MISIIDSVIILLGMLLFIVFWKRPIESSKRKFLSPTKNKILVFLGIYILSNSIPPQSGMILYFLDNFLHLALIVSQTTMQILYTPQRDMLSTIELLMGVALFGIHLFYLYIISTVLESILSLIGERIQSQ